jgi:uncharacterized protein
MEYLIICLVAFLGSGLTLFSGFGLGTLLLPVFGIFFPIELAIALTAIVHFLNNLFKLSLIGRKADKQILINFGIPSVLAAIAGAFVLRYLSSMNPLFEYDLGGYHFSVLPIKFCIALVLMFFACFEVIPALANIQFDKKYLPLGGLLSGFFGGLSGNQGALRSAFLIRANLSKEAFIATGVVIACCIDVSRLSVYSKQIAAQAQQFNYILIISATLAAFAGAYFGNRLIKKITVKTVQLVVTVLLFIFSILLGSGII